MPLFLLYDVALFVQCIGQELDPEDVAVFSVNPLVPEGKEARGNMHVMVRRQCCASIQFDNLQVKH